MIGLSSDKIRRLSDKRICDESQRHKNPVPSFGGKKYAAPGQQLKLTEPNKHIISRPVTTGLSASIATGFDAEQHLQLTCGHTQLPCRGGAKVGSFGHPAGNPTQKRP
jgi:hypothetical protein